MKFEHGFLVVGVLMVATLLLIPATGYSGDIGVVFGRTHSVTVTKARIVDQSENHLKLAGQLYRPHRLPMVGHLHVYTYNENGELVSDSKHRVLNLNSQRRGSRRLPFKISIKDIADEIDRVYLEYHSPGHSET